MSRILDTVQSTVSTYRIRVRILGTVHFHWTRDRILDTLCTNSVQLTKILEVDIQKSIPKFCIRVMSDDVADNSGKFK